jgi:hypothetical protein
MANPATTRHVPSPVLLVSCDTSGVEVSDMPISIAAALVESAPDGEWREAARWHGIQAPAVPITSEATQIHGLTEADVRGQAFNLDHLRELWLPAQAVVAWHPRFQAKMLVKVLPEALDTPWYNFKPHFSMRGATPEPVGPVRAIAYLEEITHWMSVRGGKSTRSKAWLTSILQGGRMPVHSHLDGDLPITLECERPTGKVFDRQLSGCPVGTTFRLWTRPGMDYIAAYAQGYVNGEGLSFHLPVKGNEDLVEMLQQRQRYLVTAELTDAQGFAYAIGVHVHRFAGQST